MVTQQIFVGSLPGIAMNVFFLSAKQSRTIKEVGVGAHDITRRQRHISHQLQSQMVLSGDIAYSVCLAYGAREEVSTVDKTQG